MNDFVSSVVEFNEVASTSESVYNEDKLVLYFGLILEELQETLLASRVELSFQKDLMDMLKHAELAYKDKKYRIRGSMPISKEDRAETLDGAIDLAVVALGAAFSLGADVVGGCTEVAESNMSKCSVDENGNKYMAKDANGKVMKPSHFKRPNLSQFIK